MIGEIHLFILWSNSLHKYAEIYEDMTRSFKILFNSDWEWEKEAFSSNLTRFYGKNLPKNSRKELVTGTNTFKVIIVKDENPIYGLRKTTKGYKIVNCKLFDAKMAYRNIALWNGIVESTIHATNDIEEAAHDIALFTGLDYNEIENNLDVLNEIPKVNLVGTKSWRSLKELFTVLNNTCNYVVLRNYIDFLKQPLLEIHTDIDILTDDYKKFVRICCAIPSTSIEGRVQNVVIIAGKAINFDVRYVGDNYLDQNWENKILDTKRFKQIDNVFIPNEENSFYSLLYHSLINKMDIAHNYKVLFEEYLKLSHIRINVDDKDSLSKLLVWYISKMNYSFPLPKDPSVGYFTISDVNEELVFNRGVAKKRFYKRMLIIFFKRVGLYKSLVSLKKYFENFVS